MIVYVIDVGTSSMRGILYNQSANILMKQQIITLPNYLENNHVEQAPSSWKNGLITLLKALSNYCNQHNCIPDAIALTAQRSSVIPMSYDDIPLAPAIMWQDKRTLVYEEKLKKYNNLVFSKTGSRINPVFSACKMLWFKEHQPDLYNKTKKFIVISDYLVWLMTGNFFTDTTYGSRSLLMNLKTNQWDDELLDVFQINKEKLCDLIPVGSICGYLNHKIATLVDLPEGIPIISAGGDQQCAALGLGVLQTGDIEITTGTGAFILAGINTFPTNAQPNVIISASAIPNHYLIESSILTCCSAFNWFLRSFYPESAKENYDIINSEISSSYNTPIIAIPYFQGRATPDWNSHAEASFHHINLSATRGDFAHAILEGICHEINCNLSVIREYIHSIHSIYIGGGLTKNPIFPQLEANILNHPVYLFSNEESTALGAWIQSTVALKLFSDYSSAFKVSRLSDKKTIFTPDETLQEFYQKKQFDFERIYNKLYY